MTGTRPPHNRMRRTWMFYAGAGFATGSAVVAAWAELWAAAAVQVVLAMWVGSHPWLRNRWYMIGRGDGYWLGTTILDQAEWYEL